MDTTRTNFNVPWRPKGMKADLGFKGRKTDLGFKAMKGEVENTSDQLVP